MNDSKHTPTHTGETVTIPSEDYADYLRMKSSFDAMREALESIAKFDHSNHPIFGDEAGGKVTVDALAEIARAALALAEGAV